MSTLEGDEAHAALRERIASLEADLRAFAAATDKVLRDWKAAASLGEVVNWASLEKLEEVLTKRSK